MRSQRLITSPTTFIVEDYEPGLTIDFRQPAKTSDLDRFRNNGELASWQDLAFDQQIQRAAELCLKLGVSDHEGDLVASLQRFANEDDPQQALTFAAQAIGGVSKDANTATKIATLMTRMKIFERPPHYPVRLYCHDPDHPTQLENDATHFGFVLDGEDTGTELELANGRTYPLYPQSTFCVPGAAEIRGRSRIEVMTSFGYHGLLNLGGRLEPWGRLSYIDGCTDTLLVPPCNRGDPCYNALYFPPQTEQTQHTHPSLRAGMVVAGSGVCKTPHGDHDLTPGRIFFLPPETWHSFHTAASTDDLRSALTVVAFHPDSDFGPTDQDHPMLNRTYFLLLHRLRSAQRSGPVDASHEA